MTRAAQRGYRKSSRRRPGTVEKRDLVGLRRFGYACRNQQRIAKGAGFGHGQLDFIGTEAAGH